MFSPWCSNGIFSLLLVQRSIVELLRACYTRQHLRYRKHQSTGLSQQMTRVKQVQEAQSLRNHEILSHNSYNKIKKRRKIKTQIERPEEYRIIKQTRNKAVEQTNKRTNKQTNRKEKQVEWNEENYSAAAYGL